MKSKYKYLATNTIIFSISSFGSKLLSFLLIPAYTRVLSTNEFGTADLVMTTSSLLIFLVTLCISDAVIRFSIENGESRYGVFRYGLKVTISGCLFFLFLLTFFSAWNPIHWNAYVYVFLFLSVFTNSINQLISNYLRGIDCIVSVAIMGMITTFISMVFSIVFLFALNMGLSGYLFSFIFGYLFSSLYGLIIIYKNDKDCFKQICDFQKKKAMILYSFPLIFNGLAWWINASLDRYFIAYFYGASLNGLYAAASKIPTIISVINQIFCQAWNISAIKEFDKDDKEGFFRKVYSTYNCILVISCSFLILANIIIAKLLFSNEFFSAWKYTSFLVISAVFSALSGYLGSVFNAVKNSRIFAVSTIIAAIINFLLNSVLIPIYGALGASIATAISFFTIWLIRYIISLKFMKLRVNILRDSISYIMLIVQAFVEYINGHCYIVQCFILVLLIMLYKNEIVQFINYLHHLILQIKKRYIN